MLELQFEPSSPKMEFENLNFTRNEEVENSLEELNTYQLTTNIHHKFLSIFKTSVDKLVKKPDLKNLEKLLEVLFLMIYGII